MNQFEVVLAAAEYIRKHPDTEMSVRLQRCRTQQHLMEIFEKEILPMERNNNE